MMQHKFFSPAGEPPDKLFAEKLEKAVFLCEKIVKIPFDIKPNNEE